MWGILCSVWGSLRLTPLQADGVCSWGKAGCPSVFRARSPPHAQVLWPSAGDGFAHSTGNPHAAGLGVGCSYRVDSEGGGNRNAAVCGWRSRRCLAGPLSSHRGDKNVSRLSKSTYCPEQVALPGSRGNGTHGSEQKHETEGLVRSPLYFAFGVFGLEATLSDSQASLLAQGSLLVRFGDHPWCKVLNPVLPCASPFAPVLSWVPEVIYTQAWC